MMRLKEARTRAGLTQAQLAALLNVSQVAVCYWELGTARPRPDTRRQIQDVLGNVEYARPGRDNRNVEGE